MQIYSFIVNILYINDAEPDKIADESDYPRFEVDLAAIYTITAISETLAGGQGCYVHFKCSFVRFANFILSYGSNIRYFCK